MGHDHGLGGRGHAHGLGGHDHGSVSATGRHRSQLIWVLAITAATFVLQVAGGLVSGSLALLADAGHVLTDGAGVLIALIAATLAARPATDARTYGLQRAEILAALVNALLLVGIAVWVFSQAVVRWQAPAEVASTPMLVVAVIGGLGNLASLLLLRGGAKESLNVRGAYVEVLGDLLGSVAVVIAAVVIATTGYLRADAIASVLIGLMIVPRAWSLLRDVVDVLLEATPRGVDVAEVREHMRGVPGVLDVHDLHVWTITSGLPVLSAHVVVTPEHLAGGTGAVLASLESCLGEHFDVKHCTFQIEPEGHAEHESEQHA